MSARIAVGIDHHARLSPVYLGSSFGVVAKTIAVCVQVYLHKCEGCTCVCTCIETKCLRQGLLLGPGLAKLASHLHLPSAGIAGTCFVSSGGSEFRFSSLPNKYYPPSCLPASAERRNFTGNTLEIVRILCGALVGEHCYVAIGWGFDSVGGMLT